MLERNILFGKISMLMNIVSAAMAGLTMSAIMAGHTNILWLPWWQPHCERRMACLTNILWEPMANLTVSAVMTGLTMSCGRQWMSSPSLVGAEWLAPRMFPRLLWELNGWPHLLLWAPMAGPTEDSPSPSIHCPVYADIPPSNPFCPPPRFFFPS